MMTQNKLLVPEKNNIAMYLLTLLLGTSVLIFGIYYKLDGFILLVSSISLWIISAFYKGERYSLIALGLFGTSIIVILMTGAILIDGFAGFFLFLFLVFLGFGVWINNSSSNSELLDTELMLCQNCNEKVLVGTKFCPNCGKKMILN